MSLTQLRDIYEKRKNQLKYTLEHDQKLLRSRREQLIGALTEIDALLRTIENLREKEVKEAESLDSRMGGKDLKEKRFSIFEKLDGKMRVRFENSKTKTNLDNIFLKKSVTKMKYELFSHFAKHEGYEHIAQIFKEFSENEKEHAKILYDYLKLVRSTNENIKEAANMENEFHTKMYSEFEAIARQENFKDIADFLKELAQIEAEHEKKFLKVLRYFHEKKIFNSEHVIKWKCRNCGHIAENKEAPKKCPVCKQSQAYFEVHVE